MVDEEIRKKFLFNTDDTGRMIVKSLKTGKSYYIEPIDDGNRKDWGDLNPATKKLEGDYGSKYRGAVKRSESLITEENGFENVVELAPGVSPIDYINSIDEQ